MLLPGQARAGLRLPGSERVGRGCSSAWRFESGRPGNWYPPRVFSVELGKKCRRCHGIALFELQYDAPQLEFSFIIIMIVYFYYFLKSGPPRGLAFSAQV